MATDSPMMVTLEDNQGMQYEITVDEASRSNVIKEIVESDPDDTDVIPLLFVGTCEMEQIVFFMKNDVVAPFETLKRPFKSADLTEAGVPAWAAAWIAGISIEQNKKLSAIAKDLGISMLYHLCAAHVASILYPMNPADRLVFVDAHYPSPVPDLTEEELKSANEWAWKEPTTDVVAPVYAPVV